MTSALRLSQLSLRQAGDNAPRPVQAHFIRTAPVLGLALKEDGRRRLVGDFPALSSIAGLDEHVGFDGVGSVVIDEAKTGFHEHGLSRVRHVLAPRPLTQSGDGTHGTRARASRDVSGNGAKIKHLTRSFGACSFSPLARLRSVARNISFYMFATLRTPLLSAEASRG